MNINVRKLVIISFIAVLLLTTCRKQISNETSASQNQTIQKDIEIKQSPPATPIKSNCFSFSEPQMITTLYNNKGMNAEPILFTADFNSDELDDILIAWSIWGEEETFQFEILLNNGLGSLVRGNKDVIKVNIPEIQSLTAIPLIVEDFNGDQANDIFLGIGGLDTEPFPGFQNILLLSENTGRLIDSSVNLPQLKDFPHSVTSADIDNDGDIDIYVGNMWALDMVNPMILVNDGNGNFNPIDVLLPPEIDLDQNGYSASEFVDINNDTFSDLVLGEAGDYWLDNKYSIDNSIVLINDSSGKFILKNKNAIPPKGSPSWLALDIVATDLNSDNFQDLIIAYTDEKSFTGRFFQVLINKGNGTFLDETEKRLPNSSNAQSGYIYRIDFTDIDFDNHMDLIARNLNENNPKPIVFTNNGSGYFEKRDYKIGLNSAFYTILDIENDGGTDFIYATWGATTQLFLIKQRNCTHNPTVNPLVSQKTDTPATPDTTKSSEIPVSFGVLSGTWKGENMTMTFTDKCDIDVVCGEFILDNGIKGKLVISFQEGNKFGFYNPQGTAKVYDEWIRFIDEETLEYYSNSEFGESHEFFSRE